MNRVPIFCASEVERWMALPKRGHCASNSNSEATLLDGPLPALQQAADCATKGLGECVAASDIQNHCSADDGADLAVDLSARAVCFSAAPSCAPSPAAPLCLGYPRAVLGRPRPGAAATVELAAPATGFRQPAAGLALPGLGSAQCAQLGGVLGFAYAG